MHLFGLPERRYSIFFLFVFVMTTTMKAFFRMVAASFKSESAATALAGVIVVVVALFTGYTIPTPTIPGVLRWITYLNVRSSCDSRFVYSQLVCSPCATALRRC